MGTSKCCSDKTNTIKIYLIILIIFILSFLLKKKKISEEFKGNLNKNDYKNTLVQTYKDFSLVPEKVHINRKKFLPNYKYIFFDDKGCEDFINNNFGKDFLLVYKKTEALPHKADFFRYCYLYINGGLYCDIKTIFLKPVDEIFIQKDKTYSVLSTIPQTIYQGIIYTYPRNPLFLVLINNFVSIIKKGIPDYLIFTVDFYDVFSNNEKRKKLKCGENDKIILFREVCSNTDNKLCNNKFDRYGYCCKIVDKENNILFKTRYPDFPW